MEQKYTKNQIENLKRKYIELNNIISGLDSEYDRHFTLDGHLVGSIGEVLASYYYGINLFKASEKIHDGIVDGKKVQIKITQRKSVVIKDIPDYLLVLRLEQDGDISEVYNGPGDLALEVASEKDSYNHRHMQINRLIEQSKKVDNSLRIEQKHPVVRLWKDDNLEDNYKLLVEKAQKEIRKRSDYAFGKIELQSCELWEKGNQINLWTYWQGYQLKDIGKKRIDILLVGQDWGNPFNDDNKTLWKRIELIEAGDKDITYYVKDNKSATDRHLIELFDEAFGINIKNTNHNCRLFFTNYSLGYRKIGTSETGGMTKTLLKRDKEYFEELVSILNPKIIICLGQITYEVVTGQVTHDFVKHLQLGKPFETIYKGTDIEVYGVAHCGARGYSNIGGKKIASKTWDYIAQEFANMSNGKE